ncbi:unnamed protein product [Oppiella nova]|uniref:Uncharacterized protein n=1 Tax=Oppiella nova TaxID=334625 RepID=A0A7R9M2N7_9ACAR|nr:unnamed protein product [Oppiella nova]CAG2169423.1 unnamed protein product [Oppiella nova]
MRKTEITYVRDNRQVVTNFYEAIIAWVDREVPLAFNYLDAIQNDTIKNREYIELAYSVNIRYNSGQVAYKERAGHQLNVTDTADNLTKELLDLEHKLVNGLTQAIDAEIQKGLTFWATLHQNIKDFLALQFPLLDSGINQIKSTDVKARNLQQLINDLLLAA